MIHDLGIGSNIFKVADLNRIKTEIVSSLLELETLHKLLLRMQCVNITGHV